MTSDEGLYAAGTKTMVANKANKVLLLLRRTFFYRAMSSLLANQSRNAGGVDL
jgi:hypothetical protein